MVTAGRPAMNPLLPKMQTVPAHASPSIYKKKYRQMIKSFLLLLFFFNASLATAQKSTAWYNHTLLDVKNLESSVDFYTKVFQADTIPYPFPPSPQYIVKWLRVGEGIELHLSQWVNDSSNAISEVPSEPGLVGFVHLGFMVNSIDVFLKRLMEVSSDYKSGKYKQPTIDKMPYGAETIMIKDPDGNEIHVIEAMSSKKVRTANVALQKCGLDNGTSTAAKFARSVSGSAGFF
jgi:hypothetical protein